MKVGKQWFVIYKNFKCFKIKDTLRTSATRSKSPLLINANSPLLHLLPTISTPNIQTTTRFFSKCPTIQPEFTHIDDSGKPSMVDVSQKSTTARTAKAMAKVAIGPEIAKLIHENAMKKGDVLSIAEIAGILGAKKTSELIPLCHNIPLSDIKVSVDLDYRMKEIIIYAVVRCEAKTGVEMEALTAVSVAALTVYDMCKAVSKNITITNVHLLSKTGGKSGDYIKEEFKVRDYDREPHHRIQPFVGPV